MVFTLAVIMSSGIAVVSGPTNAQAGHSADSANGPNALDPPRARHAAARFAVVGPLDVGASRLMLVTDMRGCGRFADEPADTAMSVVESVDTVVIRLDVVSDPAGEPCRADLLRRVAVDLEGPLGSRALMDAATGSSPSVLPFDPIDTGLRYRCPGGVGNTFSVADMIFNDLEREPSWPAPVIAGARAIAARGDAVVYAGTWTDFGFAIDAHWFDGDRWERSASGACRPRAVMAPGLEPAPWRPRGGSPGPRSRRIRVWVDELACASGQPPTGRITRPLVQFHDGAVVVILATEPIGGPWPWGHRSAASDGPFAFVDCQGAPAARFTVRLRSRLGDRELYDGRVYPPQKKRRK